MVFKIVRPPEFLKKYYHKFIWNIDTNSNEIYLTFDDGPIPGPTEFVLDQLKLFDAHATFFCVGNNVRKNPHLYQRILNEGHATGNHTMNHVNGWMSSTEKYINEVSEAEPFIDSKLFRPPYGRIRKQQSEVLLNKYKIIMWDVLSYDFSTSVTPTQCLSNVIGNSKQGSIIVFHDSVKAFPNLEYALPKCLEFFTNAGFQFKTLGELQKN
jgi:peptidoglycan-N-acetylglucosamine deacetylase